MKIYLQQRDTQQFYCSPSMWSVEHLTARGFNTGLEALKVAEGEHLLGTQLVFIFSDPAYNFVVGDERSEVQL